MKRCWAAVVLVWCGACTPRPGDKMHGGNPPAVDAGPPDASSTTGSSSAMASSTSSSSSGGGSSGAAGPCGGLESEIHAWVAGHQDCNVAADCARLDLGQDVPDAPGFCDLVAAARGDLAALRALTATWNPAVCSQGVCGFEPGVVDCQDKRCVLRGEIPCDLCDFSDVDPVCTQGNQNAVNACTAVNCLMDPVASQGQCRDSAACDSAGGDCNVHTLDEPRCPPGSRFDDVDPENGCAQGNWMGTCCSGTWEHPCTFLGQSNLGLATNPFTCQPVNGADVCVGGAMVNACNFPVELNRLDVGALGQGSLTLAPEGTATLVAVSSDGVHTTTCTGTLAFGLQVTSWSCRTCAGASCQDCLVPQAGICRL